MKIHLVDGTFELFRAYYSAPKVRAPHGQEVGAAIGLLRNYSSLLSMPDVTHVAVAYDHVIESFRNDLFPGYKTGAGIEPELWSQAGLAEEVAVAMGMVMWPMVEFEADDALATAAARCVLHPQVEQVVICSPDKDFAQCLVHPKVVTWDRIRDRTLNAEGAREKFGVSPESIPDFLALVGDTADGIPGIPRWGAKGASTVLAYYHTLEAIPKDVTQWPFKLRGAQTLLDNLVQAFDQALLYRKLATLRTDVPLPQTVEQLTYRGVLTPELTMLCERLGQPALAARLRERHGVASV